MLASVGVMNLPTYLVGALFIILLPGPNSLFVLKTTVTHGVKPAYQAALAVFIGDAILMFCAFIGVASLIRTTPILFTIVKSLGAIYLAYLGGKIIYTNFIKRPTQTERAAATAVEGNFFAKSLALSLTNPKSILFYVSFFVQFIDMNYAHTSISFAILAGILEIMSFIYLSTLIFSGRVMAHFFQKRRLLAKIGNGLVGLFFLGFATKLASTT